MTRIYEGFFGRQVIWTVGWSKSNGCGFVTLGIPRSLRAINKVWEQLRFTRYLCLSSDTSNQPTDLSLPSSFGPRLVMSASSRPDSPSKSPPACSSSSSSSSSSSDRASPVGDVEGFPSPGLVREDAGNASDHSAPFEGPAWVDSRVCEVSSSFYTDTSVAEFLDKVPVLKASGEESLLAFGPCSLEDRVYRERSSTEPPFFFMYSCLFADLHVSLSLIHI